MTPLDLRTKPPRTPREELAGAIFLPRSIDKIRATLPGGDLGEFKIAGFTQRMLDAFEISVAAFTDAVAAATSDDDVAQFVSTHAKAGSIPVWNRFARSRETAGGDRALALERYPWLAERPDLILSLDVVAEDDRLAFGA